MTTLCPHYAENSLNGPPILMSMLEVGEEFDIFSIKLDDSTDMTHNVILFSPKRYSVQFKSLGNNSFLL